MRVLIQRVTKARVYTEGRERASIGKGMLLFVGIGKGDGPEDIEYLSKKIARLRIFEDSNNRMNLSITQAGGQILSVSQFTLYADTRKGNRPGFDQSADPEFAREYWHLLNSSLRDNGIEVKEGIFAAHMDVDLVNNGPVTVMIDSKNR